MGLPREREISAPGKLAAAVRAHPYLATSVVVGAALALTAIANHRQAKKAERESPPVGRFMEVDGVTLHFVDQGEGETVVLLHGNGSMIQDLEASGLLPSAAEKYRVLAFDRPGFGHSTRSRSVVWTDELQADLIHSALAQLGVQKAILVGHSWGCSVALAIALKYPGLVAGLVLASGYYYPSARVDTVMSEPALPVLGDVSRYTISPILSRLMWPALTRKIFNPAPVPAEFGHFPKEMAFRPSQIRASAEETALMNADAAKSQDRYGELMMPVVIVAGDNDAIVETDAQSERLHKDITQSTFHVVEECGHMVHYTATDVVLAAIDEAALAGRTVELVPGKVAA